MQFNATPAKAGIQQVTKGGSLTKIPRPAALPGKGVSKSGQVRW